MSSGIRGSWWVAYASWTGDGEDAGVALVAHDITFTRDEYMDLLEEAREEGVAMEPVDASILSVPDFDADALEKFLVSRALPDDPFADFMEAL